MRIIVDFLHKQQWCSTDQIIEGYEKVYPERKLLILNGRRNNDDNILVRHLQGSEIKIMFNDQS